MDKKENNDGDEDDDDDNETALSPREAAVWIYC
jgi:hypothetical protein